MIPTLNFLECLSLLFLKFCKILIFVIFKDIFLTNGALAVSLVAKVFENEK